MKEIDHTVEIDHKIIMKEIGLIAGIGCKNTTKMTIKENIIAILKTREIGEIIKIVIKTNIGMKISMIVIILMVEIGHMNETDHTIRIGHIVETGKLLRIQKRQVLHWR